MTPKMRYHKERFFYFITLSQGEDINFFITLKIIRLNRGTIIMIF